jgi:hypothetical protein
MRLVARLVARLLVRLGLRWLLVGALGRHLVRWLGGRSADAATRELEVLARERLPAPANRAVDALPKSVKAAGGSVVVAGRAGRAVVSGSRRAGRLATTATVPMRRAAGGIGGVRSVLGRISRESELSARQLRARYLAATVGPDAATDALLDTRTVDNDPGGGCDPHQSVPPPVATGRRRARRRRWRPPVDRVSRTYRRAGKPWD